MLVWGSVCQPDLAVRQNWQSGRTGSQPELAVSQNWQSARTGSQPELALARSGSQPEHVPFTDLFSKLLPTPRAEARCSPKPVGSSLHGMLNQTLMLNLSALAPNPKPSIPQPRTGLKPRPTLHTMIQAPLASEACTVVLPSAARCPGADRSTAGFG